MSRALVFPVDGPSYTRDFDGFRDYQQVLGGTIGYLSASRDVGVYVHDEGLLLGLPQNVGGTAATVAVMGDRGDEWLSWNGMLRGPVILVGPADDDGETQDLAQEWLDLAR